MQVIWKKHSDEGYLEAKLFGLTVLRATDNTTALTLECIDEGLKGRSGFYATELFKYCEKHLDYAVDIIFLYIDPVTNNPIHRTFSIPCSNIAYVKISSIMSVNTKPLLSLSILM